MASLPIRKRDSGRGELARFRNEIDDLFQSFLGDWSLPAWTTSRWPVLDVAENENAFVVKAEVPGCKADDINISVSGNILSISGEKIKATTIWNALMAVSDVTLLWEQRLILTRSRHPVRKVFLP